MSATPNINPAKITGNVLNKYDATTAPTAGDDSADGYSVGSKWIDITNDKVWFCVDSTATAAIWNEAGGGGGGGNTIYTANDSLAGNRTISLSTYTLSFDGNTGGSIATNFNGRTAFISNRTNGEANILEIQDNSNNRIFEVRENNSVHINAQGTGDVVLGANAQIGTEKISLQGNTLIKGSDNSASTSGIKITDTNNASLWDFRNNGDVVVGQNANFKGITASVSEFKFLRPVNGVNYGAGYNIDLNNSANAQTTYARFSGQIVSNTSGSEYGKARIGAAKNGTSVDVVQVDSVDGLTITNATTTNLIKAENVLTVSKTDVTVEAVGGGGTPLTLYRAAGANNYGLNLNLDLKNAANSQTTYGQLQSKIIDATSGSEDGELNLKIVEGGTLTTKATIKTNTTNITMPITSTGLGSGDLWNDSGVVRIGTSGTGYASTAQGILATNALPKSGGNMSGNINFPDDIKAQFGGSSDLQIYHDSATGSSYIEDVGAGNLILLSNGPDGILLGKGPVGSYEKIIRALPDDGVELYYDNTEKFKTTNTGIEVTGNSVTSGNVSGVSTSSVSSFTAKGDGSSQDGYIQLNCWNNNHGIKLKSPPHSASATYTLTFPDDAGTNGQVLKTDGSGVLSWITSSTTDTTKLPLAGGAMTGAITTNSTFDGRNVSTDGTKLDTVATNADVTNTTSVTNAGALMDSEVTNLAQVKAFDSSDYATSAQGTLAANALPKAGGAMTGAITTNSTFDGRDVATDGTKLDTIATNADVTNTTTVTSAGALMDSELADEAGIKGITISTLQVKPSEGAFVNGDKTKLDGISASADVTNTTNVVAALTAGTNVTIAANGTIAASSGSASPLTTKGDVYTYDTADARLSIGTNGQALIANSSTATGLEWQNLSETPAVGGGLLVDLGFGSTNQVISTGNGATNINFDDTVTGAIDKNGDWDNTNKKFVVSSTSGAGTYQFEVNLFCQNSTGAYYNLQAWIGGVLKTPNGAFAMSDAIDDSGFDGASGTLSLDLDVGDEVEIKLQAYGNASTTVLGSGTWAFTQGMRVSKTSGIKGEKGDTGAPADPRIVSNVSIATLTINSSTTDQSVITAQSGALTIGAPTGSPVDGRKLIIRIKDNGTARAITFNAIFRAIGITLPTTTVASKTTYLGLVYNSADTKWDILATKTEA